MRALAARGEVAELRRRLGAVAARDPDSRNGDILRDIANELRAHGRPAEAEEFGRFAVARYEEAFADSPSWNARFQLAATLFDLRRAHHERARLLFEALDAEVHALPFSWELARGDDAAVLGYLGKIAAVSGDTDGAERNIARLDNLDRKYLRGAGAHWQARIAAELGRCEEAVRLLDESMARGQGYHRDSGSPVSITEIPEFMALREDCDAYEQFIRPVM